MAIKDIRWIQRFANYTRALAQLRKFVTKGELSELEEQGLIKAFEYTYELGWKTLKDYLEYQGTTDMAGSRDVIREAFKAGLISDGEGWLNMLVSRNLTSHSYNEETAEEIASAVLNSYYHLFNNLEEHFKAIQAKETNDFDQ